MEAEIRRHVEKLETRHSPLIGFRVSVERLHTQHRTGNVIDVHVVFPSQVAPLRCRASRIMRKTVSPTRMGVGALGRSKAR